MAPRRDTILVCVQVHYNALCVFSLTFHGSSLYIDWRPICVVRAHAFSVLQQ